MKTLENILYDDVMDSSEKVNLCKVILDNAFPVLLGVKNTELDSINDSYIFGQVDETILRIDGKLDDLYKELKELTAMLENCNER